MKSILVFCFLFLCLSASAQKKPRIDSIAPGVIIDSATRTATVDLSKYVPIDTTGQLYVLAPVQVWQQLVDALDKSNAPHTLIVELNKFIIDQLQNQGRRKK